MKVNMQITLCFITHRIIILTCMVSNNVCYEYNRSHVSLFHEHGSDEYFSQF